MVRPRLTRLEIPPALAARRRLGIPGRETRPSVKADANLGGRDSGPAVPGAFAILRVTY
jgi:hypothetical protein